VEAKKDAAHRFSFFVRSLVVNLPPDACGMSSGVGAPLSCSEVAAWLFSFEPVLEVHIGVLVVVDPEGWFVFLVVVLIQVGVEAKVFRAVVVVRWCGGAVGMSRGRTGVLAKV
jgi:hypothetical protein